MRVGADARELFSWLSRWPPFCPCHRNPRYNPAMPMTPFMERFPELGASETRSLTATGRDDLPNGEYGFIELYIAMSQTVTVVG